MGPLTSALSFISLDVTSLSLQFYCRLRAESSNKSERLWTLKELPREKSWAYVQPRIVTHYRSLLVDRSVGMKRSIAKQFSLFAMGLGLCTGPPTSLSVPNKGRPQAWTSDERTVKSIPWYWLIRRFGSLSREPAPAFASRLPWFMADVRLLEELTTAITTSATAANYPDSSERIVQTPIVGLSASSDSPT